MTPHLFFGLCRALWITPMLIFALGAIGTATYMAGCAGTLDEPPAPRAPEKRPEPRAKLRVVGGTEP